MSIIKYSIENELFGSRNLNKNIQKISKSNSSFTGLSRQLHDINTIANSDHFTRRLPNILKENEFDLTRSQINKIFSAQWLDDRKVIMGTKCNKIVMLDTISGKYSIQNPLKSHKKSTNIQNHCGIHSISINPSRSLLATGAEHVNDIAVYSLPSMEPVSVGYGAHSYWIFDILWLDDEHVCSGAGDNRLALWKIDSDIYDHYSRPKSISSEAEDSFSSSTSKSISSMPKSSNQNNKYIFNSNRTTSLKRLFPSTSSSTSTVLGMPTSSARLSSFNTSYSPLHNMYNNNSTFSSSFFLSNSFNSNSSSILRNNRRTSLNPFYSFRNHLSSQNRPNSHVNLTNDDILNENYYLNSYLNRQQNEHEVISSNNPENDGIEIEETVNDDEIENELIDSNDSSESSANELDWAITNPIANDLNEEDENSFFNNSDSDENEIDMNNRIDDDDEYDDDDDDENYESENFCIKRRRLNSIGKYKALSGIKYTKPIKAIKCKQSKRIRALAFNAKRNEIAAISMNAAFHYFDIKRFEQKYTKKLSPLKENVCLAINNDYTIYAIGSASHVQLLDANNARQLVQPVFIKKDIGVRSVHFRNDILSIGTGVGTVLFYDLRAHKFLQDPTDNDPLNQLRLKTTRGWILRNETYYENLTYAHNSDNTHAIYSHSYDQSGTKLLAVGGPLTVSFHGHYAGVWK